MSSSPRLYAALLCIITFYSDMHAMNTNWIFMPSQHMLQREQDIILYPTEFTTYELAEEEHNMGFNQHYSE